MRQCETAGAHVESGELVGAVADHRDPERLETLERQCEIEDELRSSADDADRMARDGLEVGGLVEGALRAAMHTADAAGRHDRDARAGGYLDGRGDGGRAELALRERRRE